MRVNLCSGNVLVQLHHAEQSAGTVAGMVYPWSVAGRGYRVRLIDAW